MTFDDQRLKKDGDLGMPQYPASPEPDDFRKFCDSPERFKYIRYANEIRPYDPMVIRSLNKLKRVPLGLQEIVAKEGDHIVFFNGRITDFPEFEYLKGVMLGGLNWGTYGDVAGVYNPTSGGIFVKISSNEDTILHEFGHSFDNAIGKYICFSIRMGGLDLFNKPLSSKKSVLRAIKNEPFVSWGSDLSNPKEYVAHAFQLFYSSDESRKQLEEKNPTIFQLLSKIESLVNKEELKKPINIIGTFRAIS